MYCVRVRARVYGCLCVYKQDININKMNVWVPLLCSIFTIYIASFPPKKNCRFKINWFGFIKLSYELFIG